MKIRLVVVVLVVFVSVAALLGVLLFRSNFSDASQSYVPQNQSQTTTTATSSKATLLENAKPGTTDWKIPTGHEASSQIQAYVGSPSVLPGQKLNFYVSTQVVGTRYTINIYRLGWYGGTGGRLMLALTNLVGQAQGYSDSHSHQLINCKSCLVNTKTGLVEANWQPSYTLTLPTDWTTGIYLAKFVDANGLQTYAPFDVRGNLHSTYVAVTPDATYQAYNLWGGYDLYQVGSGLTEAETQDTPRAVKVSLDRPYAQEDGSAQVLQFEADAIHWFERQGYDISYMSDIDLHEDPAQLLNHRVYISLGHDEYWSKEMRDGVENARNNGVGLAFLGANASFWQIRLEPDSLGTPDRTMVCYKVESANHDLATDPYFKIDRRRLTAEWRDPIIARPENSLIGIMYAVGNWQDINYHYPSWQLSSTANSPLLEGTDLQADQAYGCNLVGYEWDRVFQNGKSPAGLQILGSTHTIAQGNQAVVSNSTYYIAFSGAMVFATGSVFWTDALDSYRLQPDPRCSKQSLEVPGMQKLMSNIMAELAVLHPSEQLTSTSAIHVRSTMTGYLPERNKFINDRRL